MLVLVIGEFNIPHDALDIPQEFKKILVPGKISKILCTGNLVYPETLDFLRTVCNDVTLVSGQFDSQVDQMKMIRIGDFKIGLFGANSIVNVEDVDIQAITARQYDIDVLITGDNELPKCIRSEGRLFINPGSATCGPSFLILDVQRDNVTVYIYLLVSGELKISKVEYSKQQENNY